MTLTATVCMCIACHGHMQNLDEEGNQPKDGLEFISYGHYGSTVFDPMNGSYLVINLCDDCLKKASAKGWVERELANLARKAVKEIILPLIFDKPLFPLLRKTAADVREERKETHL